MPGCSGSFSGNFDYATLMTDFCIVDAFGQPGPKVTKTSNPAVLTYSGTINNPPFSYLVWPQYSLVPVILNFDFGAFPIQTTAPMSGGTCLDVLLLPFISVFPDRPTFNFFLYQYDNPAIDYLAGANPYDFNAVGPTWSVDTGADLSTKFVFEIVPLAMPGISNGFLAIFTQHTYT